MLCSQTSFCGLSTLLRPGPNAIPWPICSVNVKPNRYTRRFECVFDVGKRYYTIPNRPGRGCPERRIGVPDVLKCLAQLQFVGYVWKWWYTIANRVDSGRGSWLRGYLFEWWGKLKIRGEVWFGIRRACKLTSTDVPNVLRPHHTRRYRRFYIHLF